MHNGQAEHEEAQLAALMSVKRPVNPSNKGEGADPQDPTLRPVKPIRRPRGLRTRRDLFVLVAVGLLTFLLVLILADGGQSKAQTGPARPTATTRPTATVTMTPSPTAQPGFQIYSDPSEGFLVQYPRNWVPSPVNPGIQFDDDATNPGFEVQILVPGPDTCSESSTKPNDASVWVNCELGNLARKWQGNFEQLPGPTPSVAFGNTLWQSGVGLLGTSSPRLRVQVYATVQNGKPYIINVLANDDRFTFGTSEFFQPMLQSFKFLPASS